MSEEPSSTPLPRGRPRDQAVRIAVLDAAFALLRDRGYPSMAIEAVAARAGVGKATIYRWWPDRASLAVEAFFEATQGQLAFPDTGSAEGDFRSQIHEVAALLRGPVGQGFAAMIAASRDDPAIRRALAERWVMPRRRWGQARMHRAVEDGEAPASLDIDAALAALYSPIYAPLLLGAGIPTVDKVDAVLDLVLAGIFRRVGP